MGWVRKVTPLAMVRDYVRRFKHGPRAAIMGRDALYALRSVTNWGSYVGRGPGAERAANLFNIACIEIESAIYDLETELWAIAELSDEDYAAWSDPDPRAT